MKALTIWRPWTWAICHPSDQAKRVENRTWAPPAGIVGKRIAIHAGKTYDDGAACEFIADLLGGLPPPDAECPQGIVAVATLAGVVRYDRALADGWLVGPVGWRLADVHVLAAPVACRGAQGLWDVPPDVAARVLSQLASRSG